MKKAIIFLLFIISTSAFAQTTTTVYTTTTGNKYHKNSCRYLAKSKVETTMDKAKSAGYTACSVCKPGGATTTPTTKTPASDGRCTANTQQGTRCKRNAAAGSSRCWQH